MSSLSDPENSEVYPWSMLNFEGRKIIQLVERKWLQLLSDESCDTNVYREFLARCAMLFFDPIGGMTQSIIISGLELGNGFVVDFAVTENQYSDGIDYHLIKIETPHRSAYSKFGAISETLANAIDGIEHWKSWINSSDHAVRRLFPSVSIPNFTYWIIIGLEDTSDPVALCYNAADLINVASFHYFTQSLRIRGFDDIIRTGDAGWDNNRHNLVAKNKMSNPFFKALSHKDWLKITQRNFAPRHVISHNAKLLLKYLEDNGLTETFVRIWRKLPEEKRNLYLEHLGYS